MLRYRRSTGRPPGDTGAPRADVASVPRQLGQASPATTLSIGSLLFGEAASIGRARVYVNGQFASLAVA